MSLHDIPLAVEEQGDSAANKQKASKSNSLRRFFKLPSNKALDKMEKEGKVSEADIESGKTHNKEQQKRYHLRVGGSTETTDREGASSTLSPAATTSSASRPTLRGSISSYWNTVFKRGSKRGSSPHASGSSVAEDGANTSEGELAASESNNADEVHNLPISEDNQTDAPQPKTKPSQKEAPTAKAHAPVSPTGPSNTAAARDQSPSKLGASRSRSTSPSSGKGRK